MASENLRPARSQRSIRSLRSGLALLAVLGLTVPTVTHLGWGRFVTEKLLTSLVMPSGVFWWFLFAMGVFSWSRRQPLKSTLFWFGAFVLWTVIGNGHLANQFMIAKEREYIDVKPTGHFDAVIVLGGGLGQDARREYRIGTDTQRVLLAAQLYEAAQADRLLLTGSVNRSFDANGVDPSTLTRRFLVSLGLPDEAMIEIGGENTAQEMDQLKEYFAVDDRSTWRVGLITSAFHMPRAMRLAESRGLKFEPLPTAFRASLENPWTPVDLIPDAGALDTYGRLLKELLAGWVKR